MAKVVNLNQFRKNKARAEKRASADANAVKFGRSKAQRQLEQARAQKSKDSLDRHKQEDEHEPPC